MTRILDSLPPVTDADRARILAAPRTAAAHRALLGDLPAMNAIQLGGAASGPALPDTVSVIAWNVERCLFPEETADMIAAAGADVVLLSEVDHGMARTGQRHTAEVMADRLGMAHAFAVEFFELDLGGPTERGFCIDDHNALGWHGNAILSRAPFSRLHLLRLDDHGHWFVPSPGGPDEPRVGGRMAILAQIPTATGPVCFVSTHLESNADASHRHVQFDRLLDRVEAFAPGLPVVIGGDLNTGNHMPPDFDWRSETLFDLARSRGYDWEGTAEGTTTRPSLITRHPARAMKLDWFCTRGVSSVDRRIVPSLGKSGRPMSDHDAVFCRFAR